jgi:hypothetical protein
MLECKDMRTRQLVYANIRNVANPDRQYINDRGTLITVRVYVQHHQHIGERVNRAKAALPSARLQLRHAQSNQEQGRARRIRSSIRPPSRASERNLVTARAHLEMAESEVKIAMRIVSEHNAGRADICVVHVAPVKMPRAWPNALPGGTSRRRAERVLLRAQAKRATLTA